ncbi:MULTISPECIES: hypothetical protein [Halorussus]|uniref:hypothetical protein n=1 Tax=Halorussus TaxID=1070314 RepID=UPI000E218261|nr:MULTISPECIES: hypothetical protein [Halorussus]NHN60954.1 hypothetical protein [Halorussus sp. JP-T4]
MANTRSALAKGFSVGVVVLVLAIGAVVLFDSRGFSDSGLLVYLLTVSFALTGARGIWAGRYRVATVGAVGLLIVAVLQGALVVGLAVLLVVALVLGYSGRTREHLEEST